MSDQESGNAPYQPRTGGSDDTVSLLDLIAVIAKRKWLIVGITAASALLILALLSASTVLPVTSRFNFFPGKYRPTVTILLQMPEQSSSISSLLSQSGLGALSGLVGGGAVGGTSADLVTALLRTNLLLDQIAGEFQFGTRYGYKKNFKSNTRARIQGSLSTKYDLKSGLMQIG